MGDMDDRNTLFPIDDSDENGYIDKEKLQRLCPHLSPLEIDEIFDQIDQDHDNRIYFKELLQSHDYLHSLHQENVTEQPYRIAENMAQIPINTTLTNLPWYE